MHSAETKVSMLSAQRRLHIAALRLERARSLLSAGAAVVDSVQASEYSAIGIADARSSASLAPVLTPTSLAVIIGSPDLSPLSSHSASAGPGTIEYEIAGVSVAIEGRAAALSFVSASRIGFLVPEEIASGEAEVITTSREGYVSKGTVQVTTPSPAIFTLSPGGTSELVALNQDSGRAAPFRPVIVEPTGNERNSRLMLFATGISHASLNTNPDNDVRIGDRVLINLAESVAVEARTADGRVTQLAVEYAGPQGTYLGLDQINVVIPQELREIDRVELTLIVGERRSNSGILSFKI
ncbi:MAG: hypothetical protein WKF84_16910 [Pyrinomonadaceae bacterium]